MSSILYLLENLRNKKFRKRQDNRKESLARRMVEIQKLRFSTKKKFKTKNQKALREKFRDISKVQD